jgi:hypothetical protein
MGTYLDRCGASAQRLAPVQELFSHLADMTTFYKALNTSGKLTEIRELGITCFTRSIDHRLTLTCVDAPQSERQVLSQALAGALFALLDGWMFEPGKLSPEAADDLFHRLAWNGVQCRSSEPRTS